MIAIVDYGMGNVASVQKALNFLNLKSIITNDHHIITESNYIVLPGVGSFKQGMHNLKEHKLDELLTKLVINEKKNFLGICLGMQLIAEYGNEPERCKGLAWIKGEVKKIDAPHLRIPHMGWNDIEIKKATYFNGIISNDFYFIHSYHFEVTDTNDISSYVNYGDKLVSSIQHENIFATQFHPEKSQDSGLQLLRNYFSNVKG
jgi:glutamine amidotransferase